MEPWKEEILSYMKRHKTVRVRATDIENHLIEVFHSEYILRDGYRKFAEIMEELVADEIVGFVKSQGDNNQVPSVYNVYKLKPAESNINQAHVKYLMTRYPLLNMKGFYDEERFNEYEKKITTIHYFLESCQESTEMTANERSFMLFRDEKFLLSKEGREFLSEIGIGLQDLNCYETYEPFIEYKVNSSPENILIIENRDSYDSFKKMLQSGVSTWDSIIIDMIIYGEGNKILRSYDFLQELNLTNYKVYYFGDIDTRGIWICSQLINMDSRVQPFVYFYKELLERFGDKPSDRKLEKPLSEKNRKEAWLCFSSYFQEQERAILQNSLRIEGKTQYYIPQEGLNLPLLKQISEGR